MNKKDVLLKIGEASNLLGVSDSTLRKWDKGGKLKSRRHPINGYRLYLKSEIEALAKLIFAKEPTDTIDNEEKSPYMGSDYVS